MIDWINVKDRLPEKSGEYLIYANKYTGVVNFSKRHMKFNAFDNLENSKCAFLDVTHWAYIDLPEGE